MTVKMLSFNKDKFKIKHILGIEGELDSWPDAHDVIFHIVKLRHDKDWPDTFSDHFVKSRVIIGEDEKVNIALKELVDTNVLELSKEDNDKMIYRIINNPFK